MIEPEAKPENVALPRNVRVLGGASLLNDIASEMIYPLLPAFLVEVLGGNRFHLGIIEGIAESVSSLLKFWSGSRSDQASSRKGFILFGYTLATVVRPLIAVLTAPWQLLLVRVSDRLGKGIRTAPRDAMLADSTPPALHGRAFGFHQAMDHLGAAIGPVLAMLFLFFWPDELRLLFLLSLIPGLGVLALLLFGLKEPAKTSRPKEPVRLTLRPFGSNFRWYLLALLLFTLGNSSDMFLLERARELGTAKMYLPLLWFAFHLLKSAGNIWCGRLTDRIGPKGLILGGWLLYAGIYLAFAWATAAWQAWVFFLLYALFYALTEPAEKALVTRLAGPGRKGLAFGWYHGIIGIAALPASAGFGWLYQSFGPLAAFGTSASLALAAMGILFFIRLEAPPSAT
jgi:MFS family permease